jgi:sigma-E factor negative regulatory protein RseA
LNRDGRNGVLKKIDGRVFMSNLFSSHSLLDEEAFSAWVDGELSPEEAQSLGHRWDTDERVRAAWHRYHWLGDALRSQDLAAKGVAHDVAFVREWRTRRDTDVHMAPDVVNLQQKKVQPSRQPEPSFWRVAWAAAAAGVMVGGVLWATQRGPGPALVLAQRPVSSTVSTLAGTAPPTLAHAQTASAVVPLALGVNPHTATPVVIRDPRLDAYLLAHNPFERGAALATSITRVQAASAGQ